MCDAALLLLSLSAIFGGQMADDDNDLSEAAFDHFRAHYELVSTIGSFSAEELRTAKHMDVAGTVFGDDDVPFLAGLPALRTLDLTGTQVTDEGLKRLGVLEIPLRTLILSDTQITDAGLRHLSTLKWLEALDLSDTNVTGPGLGRLIGFKSRLTSLKLGTGTTDDDLRIVPSLEALRTLHVPTDELTPVGLQRIAGSRSLRDLRLHGNRISPKMLVPIASMTQLERLSIGGFEKVNDRTLRLIVPLKDLQFLDVSNTAITDKGLAFVLALPKLTHLVLSGTGVTDAGMKQLGEMIWGEGDDFALKTATVITKIELGSTVISDRGLEHLRALNLTHLDISRTQVTNRCHKYLVGWKLHSLNIEGDFGLTDLGFIADLPELEQLDVSHRPRMMSQISSLGGHPSLAVLDISFTDLKDSAMMKLMRCKQLRQISVAGTEVTLPSLISLAKSGTLEFINVNSTNINVSGTERRESLRGVTVSDREAPNWPH